MMNLIVANSACMVQTLYFKTAVHDFNKVLFVNTCIYIVTSFVYGEVLQSNMRVFPL